MVCIDIVQHSNLHSGLHSIRHRSVHSVFDWSAGCSAWWLVFSCVGVVMNDIGGGDNGGAAVMSSGW